nr:hypothetical protein [Tanacetum cinerariifolium]
MLNGTKKQTAPHFVGHPLARESVVPLVHIYPTKSQKDKKNQQRENGTTTGVVSRSISRAVHNGAGCYVWREREWHHHWSGEPFDFLVSFFGTREWHHHWSGEPFDFLVSFFGTREWHHRSLHS